MLLAAASAVIVALVLQNQRLQRAHDALWRASAAPRVGAWLPTLPLSDLAGRQAELGAGAGTIRLMYVFDPDCPVCERSLPALRPLLERARIAGIEPVGLSRAEPARLQRYVRERALDIPIFRSDARHHSQLGVRAVPAVLLIDSDGRVRFSHAGLVDATGVQEILAAILSEGRSGVASMQAKESEDENQQEPDRQGSAAGAGDGRDGRRSGAGAELQQS
ncbi:peroxiredoxin family protein [Luteimonas huabeiensis]|uniref:peroxiredoxin family protein n=1 Tax=Luteimonas huabeiensis TaxID=1244513 RepID=UPI000466156C|nr:TlpA disulfide reductase family protein [Luteimonas huabeiensis]